MLGFERGIQHSTVGSGQIRPIEPQQGPAQPGVCLQGPGFFGDAQGYPALGQQQTFTGAGPGHDLPNGTLRQAPELPGQWPGFFGQTGLVSRFQSVECVGQQGGGMLCGDLGLAKFIALHP
ncbi:hypothetical protein D3C76_397550 [compost metagenome]